MTELLYYTDAYIEEFDARVLSVEKQGDAYIAVLDKTAFFPEEGGQYSDTGFVGDARVLDAKIKTASSSICLTGKLPLARRFTVSSILASGMRRCSAIARSIFCAASCISISAVITSAFTLAGIT